MVSIEDLHLCLCWLKDEALSSSYKNHANPPSSHPRSGPLAATADRPGAAWPCNDARHAGRGPGQPDCRAVDRPLPAAPRSSMRTAFVIAFCGPAERWGPIRKAAMKRSGGCGRRESKWLPEVSIWSATAYGDFTGDRPLEKLARYQNRLAAKVSLRRRARSRDCSAASTFPTSARRRRGRLRPGGSGHGRTAVVDDHSPRRFAFRTFRRI